jgi:hypothetical protein
MSELTTGLSNDIPNQPVLEEQSAKSTEQDDHVVVREICLPQEIKDMIFSSLDFNAIKRIHGPYSPVLSWSPHQGDRQEAEMGKNADRISLADKTNAGGSAMEEMLEITCLLTQPITWQEQVGSLQVRSQCRY